MLQSAKPPSEIRLSDGIFYILQKTQKYDIWRIMRYNKQNIQLDSEYITN